MRTLTVKFFITLLLLTLCAQEGFAKTTPERIDLGHGAWEYRWGDSPFEEGVPAWTKEQENASWQAIAFPSNPPDRHGQTNVWYRIPLPQALPYDPTLYIFSIDLIAEFYLDGQKIYQYGTFDATGKGKFIGWPWHMISLPKDAGGKHLYVRVYSDYPDIGLWGEAVIASKSSHILNMFRGDFFRISIGSVALFVGVLFLAGCVLRFSNLETFLLSSLFLTQGLDLMLSAKSIQFFFQFPLLERYLMSFNYFFFPVGMAAFLERIAGVGPFGLVRRIWQAHLAFLVVAIGGALAGLFNLSSTYPAFDYMYYFFSLPILTLWAIRAALREPQEMRVVATGLLVVSGYWAYSSLVSWGIIAWTEPEQHLVMFVCLCLFGYVVIRRLLHVEDLKKANAQLSLANAQLNHMQQNLKRLAMTDHLTGVFNRKKLDEMLRYERLRAERDNGIFGVILLDIDDFKKVNDTFGHQVGDEVLIKFGKLLQSSVRAVDTVGRWGGEEFLIICPQTDAEGLEHLAQSLCRQVGETIFAEAGHQTASFGLAIFQKEETVDNLIMRADKALYVAKSEGKNKVVLL